MTRFFATVSLIIFCCINSTGQPTTVGSGGAIRFDGIDDYLDFGDVYKDLKLPFTISAWVYLDLANTQVGPVFANRNCDPIYTGFRLIVGNNLISMDYGDGFGGNNPAFRRGKNATVTSLNGKWNHVTAVVRGPNDMDLYLNGTNVGGTYGGGSSSPMDSSKPGFASTGYFISNGVIYRFNGMIDEMRLWDRGLSETEIRQTMCVRLSGTEPGLIGYWNFNETNGNQVLDLSSKQVHGVFVGSPVRKVSGAPIGDVSKYLYTSNWLNKDVSLNVSNQTITVNGVSAATQGVQVYAVTSFPSNNTGLGNASIQSTYFGVFLAQQISSSTFSVDLKDGTNASCNTFFKRNDNSSASWVSVNIPSTNLTERVELVMAQLTHAPIDLDLGDDVVLCNKDKFEIATEIVDPDYSFLWNTGDTSPSIVANKSGKYFVTATGPCAKLRDTVNIEFVSTPMPFSLGDDIQTCTLAKTVLTVPSYASSTVEWQDGSSNISYEIEKHGTYWATIKNACGEASDTIVVSKAVLIPQMPNVITPDNNEKNDFFVVPNEIGVPVSLKIFNRWGAPIYSTDLYENNWRGDDVAAGVYFVYLTSPCLTTYKGTLSVLK